MSKIKPVEPHFYLLPEMQTLFCRSRSWILARMKTPDFPKPTKVGHVLAWRRAEVNRYLDEMPTHVGTGLNAVAERLTKGRQQAGRAA